MRQCFVATHGSVLRLVAASRNTVALILPISTTRRAALRSHVGPYCSNSSSSLYLFITVVIYLLSHKSVYGINLCQRYII